MGILSRYDLSPATLLAVSVLPFALFFIRRKFWYRPDLVRAYSFWVSALAGLAALVVIFKLVTISAEVDLQAKLLMVSHLMPCLLVFFLVSEKQQAAAANSGLNGNRAESATKAPAPVSKEELGKASWEDLVVSPDLKRELLAVVTLLKGGSEAKKYGISIPRGILLQGPPGTGKTSLARVVAATAGLSFFVLRMDEIVSQWVGESERNLTRLFEAAKKSGPAIIFIDEVDSIGKKRGSGTASYADNLLNHLLQLIDGVVKTEGIYIIAATNRAELVDAALKRPGRLEKVIEVPLPDFASRVEIFRRALAKLKLASDVSLEDLARRTEGGSGAMISSICNQAGLRAFQREADLKPAERTYMVRQDDLFAALNQYAAQVPVQLAVVR